MTASCSSLHNNSWHRNSFQRNVQKALHPLARMLWASLIVALSANIAFASEEKTPDHIGKISTEYLLSEYPEFAKEYETFQPNATQLQDIQALAGKDVVALFGTWCHDSEREVPRLLKLLKMGNVEVRQLTLYGVSRSKGDPEGFSEKYELKYTPTIVISDNKGEVARIIEKPKGSLAGDIASQINSTK
ncbi:MAG: thiol-disulfide isomerase/thioredoxin [Pseudohongiellaceae bacterium]|jgi:thiol-disulfide isomerase/thioredoxin